MQTRVFARREPVDRENLAWVNAFTETHGEDVPGNPYIHLFRLSEGLYGVLHDAPDGTVDVWSYIVVGPEKGMLIDAGSGLGPYRALAERLLEGRPYYVVNTHAHGDHCGGNYWFDKVYCHAYSVSALEELQKADAASADGNCYGKWKRFRKEDGDGRWMHFSCEDVVPVREYRVIGCENGEVFDLGGGHEIELVFTPGHTIGSCSFIDRRNRALFCGDTIISGQIAVPGHRSDKPHEEFGTVEAMKLGLDNLMERYDCFDAVYPGHYRLPLPKESVPALQRACSGILTEPNAYDKVGGNYVPGEKVYLKRVEGLQYMEYKMEAVYFKK